MIQSSSFVAVALRLIAGKFKSEFWVPSKWHHFRKKFRRSQSNKESRRYSHLKEEALNRTMWKASLERGFGPVVRQTAKWMDEILVKHRLNMETAGLFETFDNYLQYHTVSQYRWDGLNSNVFPDKVTFMKETSSKWLHNFLIPISNETCPLCFDNVMEVQNV
jgi:hypothetical protein